MTQLEWTLQRTVALLRAPNAEDDKYRRGVVAMHTGSTRYPGAAVLGVEAAWRAGAGMVRYVPQLDDAPSMFGLPSPAAAVLAARPETVFTDGCAGPIRCDAWVIGSGTDASSHSFLEHETLARICDGSTPVVLDAGALELLPRLPKPPRAPVVITPHFGEFIRLWHSIEMPGEAPVRELDVTGRVAAAGEMAQRLGVTVLLKGSVSVVAAPQGFAATVGPATAWLATAGTGDVLAGALGALIAAQSQQVANTPELLGALAASAALLHDAAARCAAATATGPGRPITALDVAHALPDAISHTLKSHL